MPKFGETMTEGTIFNWFAKEGDSIEAGDPLFEVETDKASLEVEAEEAGVLAKIFINENESAPIGDVVAIIAAEGEDIDSLNFASESSEKADLEETTKKEKADKKIEKVVRAEGEKIKASPAAKRLAKEKNIELSEIQASDGRAAVIEADVRDYINKNLPSATPTAEKKAAARGIDLNTLEGTGAGGRIRSSDLENYNLQNTESDQEIEFRGLRKVISRRMTQSFQEVPQVTTTVKVDMKQIKAMREEIKALSEEHISYSDILILVASRMLQKYPKINSHISHDRMVVKGSINIGLAVDVADGLVVPVIKNAGKKSLEEIAKARKALVEKAREGKLSNDDLSGGTFTITNLGGFETEIFSPIVNQPEAAILGVGHISDEVVPIEGEITIRPMLWLSMAYDHRAVDGAPAAEFLQKIKSALENPVSLLLA
ncbi:2-oxo acid dehydrogenase subunit E2 [Halanaerobium sp. Z-7514]|uniref:Dihydrolipoamide acetyltransferase component of pyruvate dehydrogenase complex n=1 Tax=Halanaerobium polyolivorans TaxID=2886943 RepID=A0AAW4X1X1_9FIRM|nr:dihydrolipoamide acetyltransferase family protein [Halanaerobium polyolivorans]MCC3145826.1 2-oxo acid dehydrogenase subunit E2 [Halanaerobium polyolivorans]